MLLVFSFGLDLLTLSFLHGLLLLVWRGLLRLLFGFLGGCGFFGLGSLLLRHLLLLLLFSVHSSFNFLQ